MDSSAVGSSLLLKNCRIYSPMPGKGRRDILVVRGKIARISKNIPATKNIASIDCKGKIVAPGFIDVHIQGAGGGDVISAKREDLIKVSKTLARTGVTGYLATTVVTGRKNYSHLKAIADFTKENYPASKILGIHLEGPFINVKKKGMIREENILRPSLKLLKNIIKAAQGRLKMMTIAPEIKGAIRLIKELKKNRIIASIGHTLSSYKDAEEGVKAGITHATHLFNAMPGMLHRAPGALAAIFLNKTVFAQVISDGVHINPAILRIIYRLLGKDRIVLITDGMAPIGLKDGKYIYNKLSYKCVGGACYYGDGTLIGAALPLNKIAFRMMKFTGAPFHEVLQMATLNPAKAINCHSKGVISKGKDADLIVIDKNFNIYHTIVNGNLVN